MRTPGPWKATKDPHGSNNDYCIGMATDVRRIDRVATCSAGDAALIAAAPDLLEALKYARRFLNREDHDAAYVDAVIAKAENP